MNNKTQQMGFSLIEVLVSLLVLGIGVLGVAALQTTALRYGHDSYLRSVAVLQANSMGDRMRANQNAVTSGLYNSLSGIPSSPPNCSSCSSSDIATQDLYEWNSNNAQLLPAGQGTINNVGGHFDVVVRWDNDRTGATGLGCSGNSSVDLSCVTVSVLP